MSEELKVNPIGCPGPIPGTRIWRCDGVNCVYGPNNYASCKDEIVKRGYTLRITSDIVEEVRQSTELLKQSVQAELQKERTARADEQYTFAAELELLEIKQQLQVAQQEHFAQLYIDSLIEQQAKDERIAYLEAALKEKNEKAVTDVINGSCDDCWDMSDSPSDSGSILDDNDD